MLNADIVTRITGFEVKPGDFSNNTPNLPAVIAIFAEANEDFQTVIDPTSPTQITNLAQAAAIGGWGSPIYQAAKELFPGNNGIPVWVYPQEKAVGSTAKVLQVAATGTASSNGTHYVVVSGRKTVGGQSYGFNIQQGDTAAIIHDKISDLIQSVLGSPLKATSTDYYAQLTSKWNGLTANDIKVNIDTNGNDLGLSYVVSAITPGAGTPSVSASLALFGNRWITHVINGYGLASTVLTQFNQFNGRPVVGSNPATGRYIATVFKPLIAYSGFVSEDPSSITDALSLDVTIKPSPAPLSDGLPIEAAANDCLLSALCMQNTPHLDVIGQTYPDMPTPENIGLMADWNERDRIVKKGCSTVDLVAGVYQIEDPVTTYHPVGENPPQFRYTRNLFIDWNTKFTYEILERNNVLGKTIAKDNESVNVTNVIKPKIWRAILAEMALSMVKRGLWVDAQFTIDSIQVSVSTTNPDRFQTSFKYKRSGVVRQSDTEATAGFNVGTLTAN